MKIFPAISHRTHFASLRILQSAAILLLALTLSWPALAAPPDPGPTLGTNITWLRPNTGEWPFVNAFKNGLPWVATQFFGCFGCPEAGNLDLDPNGWVESLDTNIPNGGQAATALLFLQAVGMYPGGEYTVLYDGVGSLDYGGSASLVSSQPGRDVIAVDPTYDGPLAITLYATDPNNHLKNIRVIMPGGVCSDDPFLACAADTDCAAGTCQMFVDNYDTQIFHPSFLNNARPFGVLRLMDWMEINSQSLVDYSEYTNLDSAFWPVAPPEIMAELGNRLNADIWVNIPHLANDGFVQEVATRLRDNLASTNKLYVEYSNEVWNPDFPAFKDLTERGCNTFTDLTAGCEQDADPGNSVVCEGHPWPQWNQACEFARQRYHSRRSVEVFDLFTQIFGGTNRMVRVLSSQSGNTWLHGNLLSFENAYQKVDAFATGGYFGWELGGDPQTATWNLNQLFQILEQQEVPAAVDALRDDAQFLAGNPLYSSIPLVVYEGGQGLVAWGGLEDNQDLIDLYNAANRDSRMEALYNQLLDGWVAEGGGNLFLHYVNVHAYRPWGRYGALEYQDQPHCDSPKYRALLNFIEGLQCPAP